LDLLSVLMREMGHLLGHDHEEGSVMQATFSADQRLTLYTSDTDALWSLAGLADSINKRNPFGW
jgi:hypothetical protein